MLVLLGLEIEGEVERDALLERASHLPQPIGLDRVVEVLGDGRSDAVVPQLLGLHDRRPHEATHRRVDRHVGVHAVARGLIPEPEGIAEAHEQVPARAHPAVGQAVNEPALDQFGRLFGPAPVVVDRADDEGDHVHEGRPRPHVLAVGALLVVAALHERVLHLPREQSPGDRFGLLVEIRRADLEVPPPRDDVLGQEVVLQTDLKHLRPGRPELLLAATDLEHVVDHVLQGRAAVVLAGQVARVRQDREDEAPRILLVSTLVDDGREERLLKEVGVVGVDAVRAHGQDGRAPHVAVEELLGLGRRPLRKHGLHDAAHERLGLALIEPESDDLVGELDVVVAAAREVTDHQRRGGLRIHEVVENHNVADPFRVHLIELHRTTSLSVLSAIRPSVLHDEGLEGLQSVVPAHHCERPCCFRLPTWPANRRHFIGSIRTFRPSQCNQLRMSQSRHGELLELFQAMLRHCETPIFKVQKHVARTIPGNIQF